MLGYVFEPSDFAIVATLLLLEGVLSFDNAAVLAAMVRKLPTADRKKALLYGLGGAYLFRITAILLAGFIIANPILKIVGGVYLLWLLVKHLLDLRAGAAHGEVKDVKPFFGLKGFWGVVVAVELADIAFALDQVLVAVALTPKLLLIIVASMIAILLLRISAGYMVKLMDWFPRLETLAYVAVGWVGLKLVGTEALHYAGYHAFEVPKTVSIGVTLAVLVLPVLGKLVLDRMRPPARPA